MDPIALTRELVQIDSPTGQEGPVGDFLARALDAMGYRVRKQEVTPGRWNLLALRDDPVVMLSTHLDTVPPNLPFREDATHLHGRGTADAKGIAAAQIAAAEALAARGERRAGLLFLVGEEYGSDGARAAESLEPKGRYMINGEPTENRLALGHKGSLYAKLTARGRAAHSAYPEEGASAIERMIEALDAIRRIPLPTDEVLGPGTLNVGTIKGGVRPNVIPEHCEAELLFRTVRDTTDLRAAVTARGRAAHSAYPEEGASAIERMIEVLDAIRRIPLPTDEVLGPGTLNVGTIKGGVRPNVIPEHCEAELLFRTVRDTTDLRAAVTAAAGNHVAVEFGVELKAIRMRPLPGFETSVVRFGTDLPFLESWGEGFLLGPGSIKVAHTVDERVEKRELLEGARLYERLAGSLIKGEIR